MRKAIYLICVLGVAAILYVFVGSDPKTPVQPEQDSAQAHPAAAAQTATAPNLPAENRPAIAAASDAPAPDGLNWLEDHTEALRLAQEQNKPLLIYFSGSDWCGPCMMLKKNVLTTPVFEDFAKENLILELADFPRTKRLPVAIAAKNAMLARKYGIPGYPALIVLNPQGEPLGGLQYYRQSPEQFIADIKEIAAKPPILPTAGE